MSNAPEVDPRPLVDAIRAATAAGEEPQLVDLMAMLRTYALGLATDGHGATAKTVLSFISLIARAGAAEVSSQIDSDLGPHLEIVPDQPTDAEEPSP